MAQEVIELFSDDNDEAFIITSTQQKNNIDGTSIEILEINETDEQLRLDAENHKRRKKKESLGIDDLNGGNKRRKTYEEALSSSNIKFTPTVIPSVSVPLDALSHESLVSDSKGQLLRRADALDNILNTGFDESEDECSNSLRSIRPDKGDVLAQPEKVDEVVDTKRKGSSKDLFVDNTTMSIDLELITSSIKKGEAPHFKPQESQKKEAGVPMIFDSDKEAVNEDNGGKKQDEPEDDDVKISQHFVLLSSPETDDSIEDRVTVTNQRILNKSFDLGNLSTSSSIGNIEFAEKPARPLIPLKNDKVISSSPLKQVRSTHGTASTQNDAVTEKRSSNPFLDRLQTFNKKAAQKLERQRVEIEEGARDSKPVSEQIQRKRNEKKIPSLEHSYSDPINQSLTDNSIHIDDDHYMLKESEPVITRPAQRTQTLDSTRSRSSKEERQMIKEQKEKEKRNKKLYQEINKSKRTKDELLNEMVICIPPHINSVFETAKINVNDEVKPAQVRQVVSGFGIKSNLIYWERRSISKYVSELDVFEPADLHIIKERQSCLIFEAEEFIKVVEEQNSNNNVIKTFKNVLSGGADGTDHMIIVIIGLASFFAKLRNIENREYTQRVRENMNGSAEPTGTQTKKKSKTKEPPTKLSITLIESIISKLRVNGIKIFPTKNAHETIIWLKSFTYTVASARYDKYERNLDLANIGVIKSGVNKEDTFEKMLMQFKRMNSLKAGKIIGTHKTFKELSDYLNGGDDLTSIIGGNLEVELRRFFTTLDASEILKD